MAPVRVLVPVVALVLAAGCGPGVTRAAQPSAPARLASAAARASAPASTPPELGTRRADSAPPLYPLPAGPVLPEPCPPPPRPAVTPPPPPGPPRVAEGAVPAPLPVQPRQVRLGAVTGKGSWLTVWPDSRLDVVAVVRQARDAGLHQLWIRTGGSKQGYYGGRFLPGLLAQAHAAGVAVIAWDFPTLSDPAADVRRAAEALGAGVDGFSADIETTAEGVYPTARRVAYYLSVVRSYAGRRPLIATVPRPTPYRLASYPYAAEAPYVDVFAPMVYWSCHEPGAFAVTAVQGLRRWGRPVHLIGQAYDMVSEGGRPGVPTGRELWRFLDVARRVGALGASFYLFSQTGPAQWQAIARYPWPVGR